ncbi:CLUMA_CG003852, isoform A [Clunio marinus]|uniref:CLUMA_CG003852, isoform A n=1 Tax=Clunio marinus TaxID=568069 RepID=A0A1J1HQ10_9DIPT|nr:CLUMA_CG003852, isoform A [Clunio marinus]
MPVFNYSLSTKFNASSNESLDIKTVILVLVCFSTRDVDWCTLQQNTALESYYAQLALIASDMGFSCCLQNIARDSKNLRAFIKEKEEAHDTRDLMKSK